jgi:Arc/MetJ-type ribon-helix-helix transcriptional regulator
MANEPTPAPATITVRFGNGADAIRQAAKKSARTESEIIRTAVSLFLAAHDTPEKINAAIAAEKEAAQ